MGLELDLSELAVLRPIRTAGDENSLPGDDDVTGCVTPTTAVSSTTPRRGGGADVEATGCVTPTGMSSTTPRRGDGADADVGAGCVTPKAVSSVLRRLDGAVDDDEIGFVTPMAVSSMLRRQTVAADADDDGGIGFVTPTSDASVLRPATVCPPAPRKPARAPPAESNKRKCCGRPPLRRRCFEFFPVPRDLATVFVPRSVAGNGATITAGSSPSPPPKKIRVDVVV